MLAPLQPTVRLTRDAIATIAMARANIKSTPAMKCERRREVKDVRKCCQFHAELSSRPTTLTVMAWPMCAANTDHHHTARSMTHGDYRPAGTPRVRPSRPTLTMVHVRPQL